MNNSEVWQMLPAWRDVMEPHPDVARGRYQQAEWAVDLAQIVRGEGRVEYADPVEFFARTYLTSGLKSLLVETLRRLTDGSGEPVIQLQISFGGGKTHSLLALYHLFGGKIRPEQSATVREILDAAGYNLLPKVHTAVIVGTRENPLRSTLWGQIAMQLAKSTGKSELYEMMRENDEKKVAPGVDLLEKLFKASGACLILIDELVAYGRKLRRGDITDGGTLGNLVTFIQELTEAARNTKTALVVSIPESEAELVDENGREVQEQIKKICGRMEFVWTPVSHEEGYEIVRRRLFRGCQNPAAKEEVCAEFFHMYVNNESDFPFESRQSKFKEKLLSCYPIHPALFDFLYDKWTSLDGFQRTRGVLRFMANVVYELCANDDKNALIMPGNMPLAASSVHSELTKLLGDNWDAIVNLEVDGERSKPRELDEQNPRIGRLMAARKIARTIFMGTAPNARNKNKTGVEENEIRLGTIQPHEIENIAILNDALTKLKTNLYYLYSQGSRFWFGVNPTLRKWVDDKRDTFPEGDVEYEIEQRLKTWRERAKFKAIYICPKSSADVPDEQSARLVILSPKYVFDDKQSKNAAIEAAKEILNNRGTIPRQYKNTLLFMSAVTDKMTDLKNVVREFMAWSAVIEEAQSLNLDSVQRKDAEGNLKRVTEDFRMKLSQAYSQIFAPDTHGDVDLNNWQFQVEEILCTREDNVSEASTKFSNKEMLLDSLGCEKLREIFENIIKQDCIRLSQLWDYFTRYYYMPRLADVNVLFKTVQSGVKSKSFGLADDDALSDLQFGSVNALVNQSFFLIKASIAEEKLKMKNIVDDTKATIDGDSDDDSTDIGGNTKPPPPPKLEPLPTKFFMEKVLDNVRPTKDLNSCMNEIVSILMNDPQAEKTIRLYVEISVPKGVSKDMQEIVEDNCHSLRVDHFGFES